MEISVSLSVTLLGIEIFKSFQKISKYMPHTKSQSHKENSHRDHKEHRETFSAIDCPEGQSVGGFTARLSQQQRPLRKALVFF